MLAFCRAVHAGEIAPPSAERFDRQLVIGIGGSAPGPQFVAQALGGAADELQPHFLDNTDPDGIDRVLDGLGPRLFRTLLRVVSRRAARRRHVTGCSRSRPRIARVGSS